MKVIDQWHRVRPVEGLALCDGKCEGRKKQPTEKHGKGSQFVVIVPVGSKRVPHPFDHRRDAEAFAARRTTALYAGEEIVSAKAGRRLFSDVATEYITSKLANGSIGESSRDTLLGRLTRYVFPTLGPLPIGGLKVEHIEEWLVSISHLSANTRRGLIADVRGVFRFAQRRRIVGKDFNPAADIVLPSKPKTPVTLPTPVSIDLIAAHVSARYQALIYLAEGTGMRISELVGITLDRISYTPDGLMSIRADRQLSRRTRSSGPVFTPLKTAKRGISERSITLGPALTDRMKRHIMTYSAADGLLFTTGSGSPLTATYATGILSTAARKAGLKPPAGQVTERGAWHLFRHYHISHLLDGSVPLAEVAARAGHKQLTTTLNVYTHPVQPDESQLIGALEELERRPEPVPTTGGRHLKAVGGTDS